MKLWRLYREAHGPGLDGAGGRHAHGRWHTLGRPVVYFGAAPAIVVLERLAHLDRSMLPKDLLLASFETDIEAEEIWHRNAEPTDWQAMAEFTRKLGDDWLASGSGCVLRVPSAVVPEESNLVFNPLHPDATRLRPARIRPFRFDVRLTSSLVI